MVARPMGLGSRYIETVVGPAGEIEIHAHGFEGKQCQAATEQYEKALGTVTGRKVNSIATGQKIKTK